MSAPSTPLSRPEAVRRVGLYNNLTIGWNVIEGVVAIGAGIVAGSVSLIAFGLDSGVEVSTSVVLVWRLAQERRGGCMIGADRRAVRWIAACFAALALYVGWEAIGQLTDQRAPDVSTVGIVLAAVSVVVMPLLARAKKRLGPTLGSQAVVSESRQTELCAWLSAVVLLGLGLNAALGWWWADPVAALVLAVVAGVEAVRTWRADSLADTCCA
ncbi:MAG: cation transporter [Nitriliruptoraceae bacterium]|nr:cation transporter [Nitriliruptoraceae bacterium]